MRRHRKNYKFFENFSYFVPNGTQIVVLILLFVCGSVIGSIVVSLLGSLMHLGIEYSMLISYPISFIPPMMYAASASHRNELFDPEYPLDRNGFGSLGGWKAAALVVLATVAAGVMTDLVNSVMPDTPEWFDKVMEQLTGGKFIIDLICVSIFAPICEEWLCRGMFMRGLLNFRKKDGTRGIRPVYAILISAALFALIHMNPWQAVPAFILGVLFGYVYYRTGSLKLTMLMHCTNNTIALVLAHIDSFKDAESWIDILGTRLYGIVFVACGLLLVLIIRLFERSIPQQTDPADGEAA